MELDAMTLDQMELSILRDSTTERDSRADLFIKIEIIQKARDETKEDLRRLKGEQQFLISVISAGLISAIRTGRLVPFIVSTMPRRGQGPTPAQTNRQNTGGASTRRSTAESRAGRGLTSAQGSQQNTGER